MGIEDIFKKLALDLESGETTRTAVNRAARALSPLHYHTLESGLGFAPDRLKYGSPKYHATARLYENMARFSAARLHAFARDYLAADTLKKALLVHRHAGYYHKAETIAIHRQAQQARNWMQYQQDAPLYHSLTYDAVPDARTRPGHRIMDGITLPPAHPFWNTHYPPNGYGCRCDVRQSRARRTPERLVNEKVQKTDVPPVFRNNPAKSGELFVNHPYFKYTQGLEKEVGIAAKNAVNTFLKQSNLRGRTVKKQITYTDTTAPGNPAVTRKMEIGATGTFINKIRLLDTSRQLVALNWHQFFEMKKSTSTKKEVRGKRGGHGEVLFDEFYSMRIEDLELQFGLRKNAGKYPMYYMKEIE